MKIKKNIKLMMPNHKIAKQISVVKSLIFQAEAWPQGGSAERGPVSFE